MVAYFNIVTHHIYSCQFNLHFLFLKVLMKLHMIIKGLHDNYINNRSQYNFSWHWYVHYTFI